MIEGVLRHCTEMKVEKNYWFGKLDKNLDFLSFFRNKALVAASLPLSLFDNSRTDFYVRSTPRFWKLWNRT
jgi:hypothetical protein